MWSETVALHSLSKCNIRLSWQIHQPADMEQGACGNYDAMFLLFSPSRCTFNRNFYPALRYTWNPFTIFFSQSHPFTRCLDLSPPPALDIYAKPWPLQSPKDRILWPSTKWSWWAAEGWGNQPSPSSSCMMRSVSRISAGWHVSSTCNRSNLLFSPSLLKTMNPLKQTATGRK